MGQVVPSRSPPAAISAPRRAITWPWRPLVRADQIRIRTRGRVVTLEGLVPNTTIREMVDYDAWYVFGVDRVVNELQVYESIARQVPCH